MPGGEMSADSRVGEASKRKVALPFKGGGCGSGNRGGLWREKTERNGCT